MKRSGSLGVAAALAAALLVAGCVGPRAGAGGPTIADPFYGYGPYGPYYYGYGPPDTYRCAPRSHTYYAPIYPRYDRRRHRCP